MVLVGLNKSIEGVLLRLSMVLAGQGMGMILTELNRMVLSGLSKLLVVWYVTGWTGYVTCRTWYGTSRSEHGTSRTGYGTGRTEHGASRTGYGTGGTGLGMVLVGLMAPAEDFPHEQHRLLLLSLNPGWQAGTANPQ